MILKNRVSAEDSWRAYLKRLGSLDLTLIECFPDFMVISPGKTGTTWLAKNLSCHPEIFIPEIKEVRYFDMYWGSYDINWYLRHFQEGTNLKKGDVSPPYSMLPPRAIKLIRLLKPNLKLIFLMRDPVDRAWSTAKMCYKYRLCNFRAYEENFETALHKKFIENFTQDTPFFNGDYLGCLKRWLSFFPKEQFFVGFYEGIKDDSKGLLTAIFNFLGVGKKVNWSEFPVSEIILKGMENKIPDNLKKYLRSIYRRRAEELIVFLKEQFNIIDIPIDWENTLTGDEISEPFIVEDYKGYNIFQSEGRFYALSGDMEHAGITAEGIKEYQQSGKCLVGNSLFEIKYLVDQLLCRFLPKDSQTENGSKETDLDFDDYCLAMVLGLYPRLLESHKGYNIICYANRTYAIAQALGALDILQLQEGQWKEFQKNGMCFIGNSVEEAKGLIDARPEV